ncbi:MAG: threonylcarbamoyl-AMP synthase [Lachnospiraceae bacterium]|nr:threonylcarbamoyl-AMP synthase [Lachnospiraceae bacterium]
MKTELKKIDSSHIDEDIVERAAAIIRAGGLVAFPTETVYGLGADALNAEASARIYAAKGRPSDNPLIVHIADFADMERIAEYMPAAARLLADAFWPGPLTMIVRGNDRIPRETTGGMDTVAVRMPSHPVALELIRKSGGYIAAPSANTSGRPSPTLAEHVAEDMDGRIPMILDGGPVGIGIESTIVDLTEKVPMVLRPGYITLDMLKKIIGEVEMDPGIIATDSVTRPKAPGMKYKHYAPRADMILVDGEEEKVVKTINALAKDAEDSGKKVGIIATDETRERYGRGEVVSIGARQDEDAIARHLYRILREFDERNVDVIYSESFATPRIGQAIMNRLLKAAGHQIITV